MKIKKYNKVNFLINNILVSVKFYFFLQISFQLYTKKFKEINVKKARNDVYINSIWKEY